MVFPLASFAMTFSVSAAGGPLTTFCGEMESTTAATTCGVAVGTPPGIDRPALLPPPPPAHATTVPERTQMEIRAAHLYVRTRINPRETSGARYLGYSRRSNGSPLGPPSRSCCESISGARRRIGRFGPRAFLAPRKARVRKFGPSTGRGSGNGVGAPESVMRAAAFVRYAGAEGLGHVGWALDLGSGLTDCGAIEDGDGMRSADPARSSASVHNLRAAPVAVATHALTYNALRYVDRAPRTPQLNERRVHFSGGCFRVATPCRCEAANHRRRRNTTLGGTTNGSFGSVRPARVHVRL